MELRVIGRGVLAGFLAGLVGFVIAWIWAEPQINKAIEYEDGRDHWIAALNAAAGMSHDSHEHEIFSRDIQSTLGLATGVIGFSMAMGALCAVAYLVLHGRFAIKPQTLAWLIAGFGLFGVYLLPFVKYPANPPAVGHEFTIVQRSHLYLALVAISLALLGIAVYAAVRLTSRIGRYPAVLAAAAGFLVIFGIVIGVLPSVGKLSDNKAVSHEIGFAPAPTETPQPVVNVLDRPLTVTHDDGMTQVIAPGQIVYPGFDADVLWKFRWYSLLSQLAIWTVIAVVFGVLIDRLVAGKPALPRRKKELSAA
jgi:hypothetical protein